MTERITIEATGPAGTTSATIGPGERLGSMAVPDDAGGRRVLIFGWWAGTPGVWQSVAGVDIVGGAARLVASASTEQLADLREGPFERTVEMAAGRVRLRWSLDG